MSLLVKIEGDPLNTQHKEEEAVFIRDSITKEDSPTRIRRSRGEEAVGGLYS